MQKVRWHAALLAVMAIALAAGNGGVVWGMSSQLPHLEAERHKNLGVAYLEQEQPKEAARAFRQVVALVPDEALGTANLGLSYLRLGQADSAAIWLDRARKLEPDHASVILLVAEVQQWKGDWASAMEMFQEALRLRPADTVARYSVYRSAIAQQGDLEAPATARRELAALFAQLPKNVAIAAKIARSRAEAGDFEGAAAAVKALRESASDGDLARRLMGEAEEALTDRHTARARRQLTILENVLRPTPRYKQSLGALQSPVVGMPLTRFSDAFYRSLKPERPPAVPVRFVAMAATELPEMAPMTLEPSAALGRLDVADMDGDGREDLLVAVSDGRRGVLGLWSRQGSEWKESFRDDATGPASDARLVDFDNDGAFDLVSVSPGGLRLLRGDSTGAWTDVSAAAGLPADPFCTLELIDSDNEGDLDFCAAAANGLRLYENRLDGSFRRAGERAGLGGVTTGAQQIVALDHDDDLDMDLLVIDGEGRVRLFDNLRQGRFAEEDKGADTSASRQAVATDVDNDGWVDLMLVGEDGDLRLQRNAGGSYEAAVVLPTKEFSVRRVTPLDIDNDGWMDLAAAGVRERSWAVTVLRNVGDGSWEPRTIDGTLDGCLDLTGVDLDGDGDLELLALDVTGKVLGWRNEGGNANHWMRVRLQGLRTAGTKNNLHGIGSKVEIKAGLHYQLRTVRRPVTHLGLGRRPQADLMRVTWSNGVPQNTFRPVSDQTILEPQILKGSCPYLYSWDGSRFVFVTDLLAAAPLGLAPAEGVIAPDNPRELMTIPRDRIGTQYGSYVFQYTSELWETVYLDEVALWAVDHRPGTEVFTDQRFLPPPYGPPRPVFTEGRVPPVLVENTAGEVVTERLLEFDHRYPESLRSTRYQGMVAPHELTLHFGEVSPLDRPMLVIGCWIFWTDTSINVSMSQGKAVVPGPTTVETWHPEAGWRAVDQPFGLPNGKDKWALLDLADDLYAPDARVRLRTSSQIHWDQAFLTNAVASAPHRITRIPPKSADLHYGGFSRLYRPAEDGPHLYDYSHKVTLPVWQDMVGMVTRYGDVTELLTASDDRFAVFTAGDEVTIRFDAGELPELESGWERDFLFYSDGWEKDADRNTVTGDTVGPLPFHAMSAYPYPATEAYPDGAVHRAYLTQYQTRRIGPEAYRQFVKAYRGGEVEPLPWALEPGVKQKQDQMQPQMNPGLLPAGTGTDGHR